MTSQAHNQNMSLLLNLSSTVINNKLVVAEGQLQQITNSSSKFANNVKRKKNEIKNQLQFASASHSIVRSLNKMVILLLSLLFVSFAMSQTDSISMDQYFNIVKYLSKFMKFIIDHIVIPFSEQSGKLQYQAVMLGSYGYLEKVVQKIHAKEKLSFSINNFRIDCGNGANIAQKSLRRFGSACMSQRVLQKESVILDTNQLKALSESLEIIGNSKSLVKYKTVETMMILINLSRGGKPTNDLSLNDSLRSTLRVFLALIYGSLHNLATYTAFEKGSELVSRKPRVKTSNNNHRALTLPVN